MLFGAPTYCKSRSDENICTCRFCVGGIISPIRVTIAIKLSLFDSILIIHSSNLQSVIADPHLGSSSNVAENPFYGCPTFDFWVFTESSEFYNRERDIGSTPDHEVHQTANCFTIRCFGDVLVVVADEFKAFRSFLGSSVSFDTGLRSQILKRSTILPMYDR